MKVSDFENDFIKFYNLFMSQLKIILPLTSHIFESYDNAESEYQQLIQNLAQFFNTFFTVI